jgi:AraC-like DNA-binding protein
MAKPPPSIAATSTLAMVRTAEARGIDPSALLRDVGLSRHVLDDPDARLPGHAVLTLWDALRERTGDPVLQLAAPTSLPFGAYRVIDYLVGASATVGEGVDRFARFFRLIADGIVVGIEPLGTEHHLCLTTAAGTPVPPVYVDYVFAALVRRVRMRIRPALEVQRVELCRPQSPWAAAYRDAFRAPVRFGAASDRLCFSNAEWLAPIDGADEALARLLEEHARGLAEKLAVGSPVARPDFSAAVRTAFTTVMPEGGSAEDVARALNVSVRTLQRKLAPTGSTFREVSETVRARLAQEYLADPAVSIAEVAFMLGFSEQSSFNRAFRRWTGEAPGRWRRRLAAGAPAV